jgi:hypothetical protein
MEETVPRVARTQPRRREGAVLSIYYDDDPFFDPITHEPPAEQTDAQNERIQNDDYSDLEEDAKNKKPGD